MRPPGKIIVGLASSVIDPSTAPRVDATFVVQTTDGATIVVTERAAIPGVEVLFATASEKYGWLNNVTAWASGAESNGAATLNYWQVRM